ncbi:hypothetical protein SOVF_125440 [Spinacia oleracea]|uniref:Protein SOB FIVE-LIKE 5 n=1 Tax=Spinacia oleracea TaxID=3562 RepID=A0A9R0JXZ3_SPIOL|nr:protein SOB FIVE-LIKE 5-like [Spinacia oleracea]KNA12478.1 hypothetical protein SOVF_125440 [Spinacia oleracea]
MDIAGSEWSNGCESGWTVYLEESYIARTNNVDDYRDSYRMNSTRNEEDLSMVSDASSGPPHFLHDNDDNEQSYSRKLSKKSDKISKKSSKELKKVGSHHQHQHQHQHQQYHLDDTASSPAITHSKIYDNSPAMDFSQNMSAAHYQGTPSYNNHYGAFWQSSHIKDDTDHSAQHGQLRGRRWE